MDLPERTADLTAAGISKDVLAGRRFRRVHRGIHVAADVPDSPDLRIQAASRLMRPGDVLGGWAAARLLGARHLDGIGPDGPQDVLIHLPRTSKLRPRPGIRYLRSGVEDVRDAAGLPVTSPEQTVVDLIRWAQDPKEGIAAAECLLATPLVSVADVRAFATAHPGMRGLPALREVLELLGEHSWSPGETRLRLVWQCDAGLVRPLANVDVFTADGHRLGVVDLLDPVTGLVAEYDGRTWHERRAREDHLREARLETVGLRVLRFFEPDVTIRRPRTVHRLHEAQRLGLAGAGWSARLSDGRIVRPGGGVEPSAASQARTAAERSTSWRDLAGAAAAFTSPGPRR
ncbi:DUF559 domain-containing protein [Kineococcus sp. GCM10028916]|uniref:DUF559 domain-containing protein n=1 Tax=Kineococcus sp. GCM10028916 TaxID=3273394 RepID=UPI00362AC943